MAVCESATPHFSTATSAGRSSLPIRTAGYFRVNLRLFEGDAGAPTVALLREADSCLPFPSCSLVGLVSAPAGSAAILPPSFSHRSSIFFFRRFLSIGLDIALPLLSRLIVSMESTRETVQCL